MVRSPIVAEFLSFIDTHPFCQNRDIVDHFAQDEVATRLWGRPFRDMTYQTSIWIGKTNTYKLAEKKKRVTAQVYSKLSFFLYKYNNHLVEGGGKLCGMPSVTELRRDDGRMGYMLTPYGMANIADWRERQVRIAEFEERVRTNRGVMRKELGV